MDFTHPGFLILAAVLPLLWLAMRRSLADMTPAQRIACFAVRCVILLCLVLALAGWRLRLRSQDVAALFLVDQSASISPDALRQARDFISKALAEQRRGDDAGVIGFAARAEVLQRPAPALRLAKEWPVPAVRDHTNFADALSFASAIFPTGKTSRIVLLSDGNDTESGAGETARRLAASGLEVYTVPLRNPRRPEVLAESLEVPVRVRNGEPFDATARIRSNAATTATVKLYQNQFLVNQAELTLKPGENVAPFRNLKTGESFARYEIEVVPAQDTLLENNRAQSTVSSRGEPRVLIVDRDKDKIMPLADALRAEKITVETRGPAGLPKTIEDLQGFDLFILSDVGALRLTGGQMETWQAWVRDFGGGFAMLGGEESFGVGGYFRTPVEQMLPVRVEHEDRQETPTVALLVVLDRSGSMAAQVSGQTKISLADQGAVHALNVLQPKDLFGVFAVDTQVHSIVPLARPENRAALEQKITGINSGGGGIYIYTSLAEAFAALRDVSAKIKHVILFSDAADAEEKASGEMPDGAKASGNSFDLATAMLASRITTSVVALGAETDKDTEFLRQLAERGGGRFYLTSDALTLPQIFSTETMKVTQSSLVEEPFLAVPAARSPIIDGIDWPQSPLLLGYNATKPKPTAGILLVTERGEPLLATWRYGLGQTAAFTSDAKARWASEWLKWPGYGKFWTQLVRALLRKADTGGLEVTSSEAGDRLAVEIQAVAPDGSFRNDLPVTVSSFGDDAAGKQTVTAEQIGPGSYLALMKLPPDGTTLFSVSTGASDTRDSFAFGYTRSYPREFLTSETNEEALRALAGAGGGKFDPAPQRIFSRPKAAQPEPLDLRDYLLSAALILFPIDIWLRRRTWN